LAVSPLPVIAGARSEKSRLIVQADPVGFC
jgi:hypothetical protein